MRKSNKDITDIIFLCILIIIVLTATIVNSQTVSVPQNVSITKDGYNKANITNNGLDVNIKTGASVTISNLNITKKYIIADLDTSSTTTQYYGYNGQNGIWYIMQWNTISNTFRYYAGTSGYTTSWTNRVALVYDYFYNIF